MVSSLLDVAGIQALARTVPAGDGALEDAI
jgi:hypothetical protein